MSDMHFQSYAEWMSPEGGLSLSVSRAPKTVKAVHVVLDAAALATLLNDTTAKATLESRFPNAEIIYDVDVALLQRHHPRQISTMDLWGERVQVLEELGSTNWQTNYEAFSEHVEQLSGASYSTYGLLNSMLQAYLEGSQGTTLQQRIGLRVRRLSASHNAASALYPDEFFAAAARALVFASALPVAELSKDIERQARLIEHTWAPILWARAAHHFPADDTCATALLISDNAAQQMSLGAGRPEAVLQGKKLSGELSHELLQLFFASLQHQLPIAPQSREAAALASAVAEGQRSVESAVMVDHARVVSRAPAYAVSASKKLQ